MANGYNGSTSPNATMNVVGASVTYDTTLTIDLINAYSGGVVVTNPTVKPGDVMRGRAVLTATGVGPVAGAIVTFSINTPQPASGGSTTTLINGTTDASGAAYMDLSPLIAKATATLEGFGVWTIHAIYAGQLPSGYAAGFAPATNFINYGVDDPGFYYENGQIGSEMHGAHGTPYLPGGEERIYTVPGAHDAFEGSPVNRYGMVDPGMAYGVDYFDVWFPKPFNTYGGDQAGYIYEDGNVTDRSGGVEDSIQHAQNINFYRPNAMAVYGPELPYSEEFIPGYLGDPQFNNYGNQYVDTNVTDRSGGVADSLQAKQNPNFYRNHLIMNYEDSPLYYGPLPPDDVLTNPVYMLFSNEPSGQYQTPVDTARKTCNTY